jgi:hypothetical protein
MGRSGGARSATLGWGVTPPGSNSLTLILATLPIKGRDEEERLDHPPRQLGSEKEQGFGCSTGIFSWVLGSVFVS